MPISIKNTLLSIHESFEEGKDEMFSSLCPLVVMLVVVEASEEGGMVCVTTARQTAAEREKTKK